MKSITPRDLKDKLERDQAVLVDVREPAEFKAEHISNAYLIPQNEVTIEKLPFNNKMVVFICRSGKRSGNVCEKFMTLHPEMDVYSLTGGINGWKEAGYEVIKSSSRSIPLDRQIKITTGSFVLLGVLGGWFINRNFYLLAGFIGSGLIFADLTGWCGMGKILAMMPWNK